MTKGNKLGHAWKRFDGVYPGDWSRLKEKRAPVSREQAATIESVAPELRYSTVGRFRVARRGCRTADQLTDSLGTFLDNALLVFSVISSSPPPTYRPVSVSPCDKLPGQCSFFGYIFPCGKPKCCYWRLNHKNKH